MHTVNLFPLNGSDWMEACRVGHNIAPGEGGVIDSFNDIIKIESSEMDSNTAKQAGGTLSAMGSNITIASSQFSKNTAGSGGVIKIFSSDEVSINKSNFSGNSATETGGVLYCSQCTNMSIKGSEFNENQADHSGRVLLVTDSTIRTGNCNFTANNSTTGSVIYATHSSIINHSSLLIANSTAKADATMYLLVTHITLENDTFIFSHNSGSLVAFKSTVIFMSTSFNEFVSNQQPSSVQEGGAITLF